MKNISDQVRTDLSPLERKKRVHRLRVQFPARSSALALLERCLTDSAHSADPKCLFMGGETGVGKTTLINAFLDRHPRIPGEEVDRVPVLVAPIPAVATTKSTASSLLDALGDPKAFYGELARLTDRLLKFLIDCGVQMIVLDEFQHVIDRESSKVLARTADWLKTLLDNAHIPIVLVGLPHSERILNENPQLARRFPRRFLLERFSWGTAEKRAEFRMLLKVLDEHLPFAVPAGLDHPETAEWFFKHTDGTLGLVVSLVREAAELAIDRGALHIDQSDLQAAHSQMRASPPLQKQPPKLRGRGSRGKASPSVGETLRT